MPSIYAHFRFGDQAAKLLPESMRRSIARFPQLFSQGVHGPDFFFFYQPLFKTQMGSLGDWYHGLTGREFFHRAAHHLADNPSEGAKVYLYGVLCHYTLDSVCHPMINAATANGNPVHTELETEFDRVLLTKDGRVPPERQYLGRRLKLTWGESVTVAGFYPPATVYTVRRSVRLMAAATRLMTMKNRRLLQMIFNLGGEYASKMVMQQRPNRRCSALIPQLEDLYEQALEQFPTMAAQLEAYLKDGTPLGAEFDADFNGERRGEEEPKAEIEEAAENAESDGNMDE